ncbi:uncharacterized protein HD556DRAFT_1406248 [Suillus plorans]|uniref:Velvet domain-containing protein n=1 Tax=Suillus plorans TaxID=116603 RepID=A0A9P7DC60_9AGAM|nr:uncharacterized protein HD556DRAFT_1406248 [Suillus plorans]KAG1788072.1 hypothetical protein HD556DRAFT_1406248 [Suillus plorans]
MVGRKHYSLEVVQHPMRARMCGFGDEDRRPRHTQPLSSSYATSKKTLCLNHACYWTCF